VAASAADARAQLEAVARGDSALAAPARPDPPRVAFLFGGESISGMGQALYAREPVFQKAVDACGGLQSGPFALAWGRAALRRAWGTAPAAAYGGGVGEVAAACVAGALALPDALVATEAVAHAPPRVPWVRSADGVAALVRLGVDGFVEIGPSPGLLA